MAAAQLYQSLIVNPTHNAIQIRRMWASGRLKNNPALIGRVLWGGTGATAESGRNFMPVAAFKRDITMRQFNQQWDLDAAMWYGAIHTGPYSDVIKKLFHIFFYAGVMYRDGKTWKDWNQSRYNVAALLSHGGRVLVQLPDREHGGEDLWRWLNEVDTIPTRWFATHGISFMEGVLFGKTKPLIRGHRQYLSEDKYWSITAGARGLVQSYNHGFNPALGGLNNRNPFSKRNADATGEFDPIDADGRNGHVYIYYLQPGNGVKGGMLVGCENAASQAKNPHTGASHGASGASADMSPCGGKKWTDLNIGPGKNKLGGVICDLTDRPVADLAWLTAQPLFNADWLDRPTQPVADLTVRAPAVADAPVLRAAGIPLAVAPRAARAIPK